MGALPCGISRTFVGRLRRILAVGVKELRRGDGCRPSVSGSPPHRSPSTASTRWSAAVHRATICSNRCRPQDRHHAVLDAPVARIRAHLDEALAHQRPERVRQGRYPYGQVAGENLERRPFLTVTCAELVDLRKQQGLRRCKPGGRDGPRRRSAPGRRAARRSDVCVQTRSSGIARASASDIPSVMADAGRLSFFSISLK